MASSRALRRLADALLRGAPQYEDREVRLAVHDGLVCWDLWVRPHCWSSGTPRWRQGSVNLADAVLGPARYEREVVGETRVVVPMPEGGYRGRVVHDVSRWTRPRWPWPKVVVGGTLEMDEPVPVPGKGENGYDLDEDAIHSLSFAGNMASDAVGRMVGSALRTRERREGLGWVPEGGPHGTGGRKSDEAPLEAG
jgi:hypothetical protein